jgi:uncharacterized protein
MMPGQPDAALGLHAGYIARAVGYIVPFGQVEQDQGVAERVRHHGDAADGNVGRFNQHPAACEQHGLIALFHTGTSGIGARQPGGQGIRIDLAHPLKLDPVAAAHPDLTIVAAHFGWPWQMDLIAIALHKTNVYIDISGWAPKRIPAEVIRELRGRLSGQFVRGSDFPFFTPDRCLADLGELDLPADAARAVLHDNAARILAVSLASARRPAESPGGR